MAKEADLQVLKTQYEAQGFTMLENYTKKNEGILCQITQGRYKGYLAKVTPVYIQQRTRKNAQGDIKLTALIPSERKRFMDTETQKRGYTILDYPEDFHPTRPIKIQTPEGKIITSPKWNGFFHNLEQNFDKATKRRTDTAEDKYLKRYAIWEHEYNTRIIGEYTSTHEKATFIFMSGEFAGLLGTMENAGIREMRVPSMRALTPKSLSRYYSELCATYGLDFIDIQGDTTERSRATLLCKATEGNYAGYYCTTAVATLRRNVDKATVLNSLKQLGEQERHRLVKDIVGNRKMTVVSMPNILTAHSKLTIRCSYGHEYTAMWYNIFQGGGWCPKCKATSGEQRVALILEELGLDYAKEYRVNGTATRNPQFFDFYIKEFSLAIEYNGLQHYEPVDHFGGTDTQEYLQELDQAKRDYCNTHGITLIELPYILSDKEIKDLIQEVIKCS